MRVYLYSASEKLAGSSIKPFKNVPDRIEVTNNRLCGYVIEGKWDNALATAIESAERDAVLNMYVAEMAIITLGLDNCILAE